MKINLIVWDEEKNRPIDQEVEAMGVTFKFDDLPGEYIRIEPLLRSTRFPDGGVTVRSMHRTLTVIPEANNAITLLLRR